MLKELTMVVFNSKAQLAMQLTDSLCSDGKLGALGECSLYGTQVDPMDA